MTIRRKRWLLSVENPLANLTKETLTKMRIDQSFDVFYPITLPARVKAWLAIQRLQESDALRPGWRLVS